MIIDDGKYYLYRHIRLDKNEVFYVGIGSKSKIDRKYGYYIRAYSKDNRNTFWKKVVNKTTYKVEILLESDDYKFIKQKEIEFIRIHGRRNLNLGTLVNLTNGGEGLEGFIMKEVSKLKISKSKKGKPYKGKVSTIFKYSLDGEFLEEIKNIRQFCIKNNFHEANLLKCANGIIKTCHGFIFKFYKTDKIKSQKARKKDDRFKVKIYVYNKGLEFLGVFFGITELTKMGFLDSKIYTCCLNKRNNHKQHVFSYRELSKEELLDKFYSSKSIIQMDLEGNFIKEWQCGRLIIENLEFVKQLRNILMCCNNTRNKAYGYKWKYK